MTFVFDLATDVTKSGGGRYDAVVLPGWDINGNANGGYLFALAGRAMIDHSGRRDPFTVTAHYLAPVQAGPVHIDVDTVKSGRILTKKANRGSFTRDDARVHRGEYPTNMSLRIRRRFRRSRSA